MCVQHLLSHKEKEADKNSASYKDTNTPHWFIVFFAVFS